MGPGDKQDDLAAIPGLLGRLQPEFLPQANFHAVARLVVTPTFVVIPLLQRGEQTLVHLARRGPDDPHYANMLHPAGTVIRASDKSLNDTYERLVRSELSALRARDAPVFVDVFYAQIKRGREISLVHWIALEGDGDQEGLYDSAALPAGVIPTDITRIEKAAHHFPRHSGLEAAGPPS
jgi:hypothetical protein